MTAAPARVMVIGRSRAGKSTLLKALGLLHGEVRKTQAASFGENCIDTPGEFLEQPFFRKVLNSLSCKADLVLMVAAPFQPNAFPPRMAQSLGRPALGVVTQIDVGSSEEIERVKRMLFIAGASEVLEVSALTGEGVDILKERVNADLKGVCE